MIGFAMYTVVSVEINRLCTILISLSKVKDIISDDDQQTNRVSCQSQMYLYYQINKHWSYLKEMLKKLTVHHKAKRGN